MYIDTELSYNKWYTDSGIFFFIPYLEDFPTSVTTTTSPSLGLIEKCQSGLVQ